MPSQAAELVLPTPTPFIYTVVQNDTLFAIAANFNISLDALMAANPGVDARALSPGTELIIPTGAEAAATSIPQITPVPVTVLPVQCYSSAAGELWCFLPVVNDGDQPLENVTGIIQLVDASGEVLANMEAVPPLDVVAVGTKMPLVGYLDEAPAGWTQAQAELLSAFWLPSIEGLYVNVTDLDFDWAPAGENAARVQGTLNLAGDASSVWVLAVAYDSAGSIVGVRRWESAGEPSFNFWVYSLAGEIADVQVLAQARP